MQEWKELDEKDFERQEEKWIFQFVRLKNKTCKMAITLKWTLFARTKSLFWGGKRKKE